jgi:hypothetical protein
LASIHDHPTGMHTDSIAKNREEANRLFDALTATTDLPEEQALLTAAKADPRRLARQAGPGCQGGRQWRFQPGNHGLFSASGANRR